MDASIKLNGWDESKPLLGLEALRTLRHIEPNCLHNGYPKLMLTVDIFISTLNQHFVILSQGIDRLFMGVQTPSLNQSLFHLASFS